MPPTTTASQPRLDTDARALVDTTFVVLDLETTGLSPDTDRITEVGAVKVRGGEVLGELQTLVHPGRGVPPAVQVVTGITDPMLAGAPRVAAVLPMLLEFVRGTVLVAHNARFDVGFLDAELGRHDYPRLANDVVDTARLARRLVRDEVRDLRLATLARHFRARTTPTHRALLDARATVDVLHGLLERAGTIGATTVEDLLDYQRSSSEHAFRKVSLADGAPSAPGVYRFHDGEGRVLYVGKATSLRPRLRRYFGQDERRHVDAMVREAAEVTWSTTPTEVEAAVRELRELAVRRPRYNRRSTRPPADRWLRLTDEPFPRLSVARSPGDDPTRALGPLPGQRAATGLLEALQEVVPVRRCTFRIRAAQDHATCVLKELGRCPSPCDGTADAGAYAAAIGDLPALVAGEGTGVLALLAARMAELAAEGRYEEAARVRARRHAVARALDGVRSRRRLGAVPVVAVARRTGERVEAVRLRHGLLVASAAARDVEDAAAALAATPDEPPPASGAATRGERGLLARWVDAADAVLLEVEGELTDRVAGGAALAAALVEAREVDRATRRDRRTLGDRRRRDRERAPTPSSVAGRDAGSGSDELEPG